ncbi:MAG: bacillithiol biosynthesis deacetylase BshB1 [Pedosphaera sp.]|nr:bacillithiol biosynthesis deacetylase BshB1 [Pedosphaera sp.]
MGGVKLAEADRANFGYTGNRLAIIKDVERALRGLIKAGYNLRQLALDKHMNPYQKFVAEFARLVVEGKSLPLGDIPPQGKPKPAPGAPVALIFSPHPDDECIIGGFALRLMRESGLRIINVAVTQGSSKDRQQPRLEELQNACNWLGFDLEQTAPNGLEKINPQTRVNNPEHWAHAVKVIAASLAKNQPRVIFFPHELDWNGTHIGTHFLVMDALKTLPANFQCCLVETEFWGQMPTPNLMVESSAEDVADMLAALSFHVGEVQRNPYHLRMPQWMQDNVRRGAELVGGQGGAAPNFMFATLYRLRQWQNGRVGELYSGGRQIGVRDNPGSVFGWNH